LILKQKQYNKKDTNLLVNNSHENTQIEKKWVTFTYVGRETRHITKLFKNTTAKTAYRSRNIMKRCLQPKLLIEHGNKYSMLGVYELKCSECHLQYIGQRGSSFLTIYKEHIRAIKYNKESYGYAQHILNTGPSNGKIEYHGHYKNRKQRKTFRYARKISRIPCIQTTNISIIIT
jgi:hypothetical protein